MWLAYQIDKFKKNPLPYQMHPRLDVESSYLSHHTVPINLSVALVPHAELDAGCHTPVPLLKT